MTDPLIDQINVGAEVVKPIPTRPAPDKVRWLGNEGERDDLDIYFHSKAYKAMMLDLKIRGSENETAGALVGRRFRDQKGRLACEVTHYLPFSALETGRSSVTMTADSWTEVVRVVENELGSDYELVGTAHSHPGFGLFLSSADDVVNSYWQTPGQIAINWDPSIGDDSSICVYSKGGRGTEMTFARGDVEFGHGFRRHVQLGYVEDEEGEGEEILRLAGQENRDRLGEVMRIEPEEMVEFFIKPEEISGWVEMVITKQEMGEGFWEKWRELLKRIVKRR